VDLVEASRDQLHVAGWISDLRAEPGPGRAVVRLRGAAGDFMQEIAVDRPRSDLRRAFGRPIGDPSGFEVQLSSAAMPAGAYELAVYRASMDGWIVCHGGDVRID
jgi:hypothetical protein